MTKPDFQFLRTEPVDLKRYLPVFLYRSPEFKAIQESLQKEHERQRLAQIDVAKQFHVATATWGLSSWEKMLELDVNPNATVEGRRTNILIKLAKPESVTEKFLTRLINKFIADGQGFIINYPKSYMVDILYHGGQVTDYAALRETVRTYLPAHLGFKLTTLTAGRLAESAGATVQCYRVNTVGSSLDYHLAIKDTPLYCGGTVIHVYKTSKIYGGGD